MLNTSVIVVQQLDIELAMQKILNHHQENIPHHNIITASHPSYQTTQPPYKPTIKVGYHIIQAQQPQPRRYRKPIVVAKPQPLERRGLRKVMSTLNQGQSGRFIREEYVPQVPQKPQARFQKRAVEQAHLKYQSGRQFSQELRSQFVSKNRQSRSRTELSVAATERSKLSGYSKEGIKDILEYHHAGNYRETKLANKCNNEKPRERSYRFSDIHDVDFRKAKRLA